jgi:hypothetical protein
LTGYYRKFVRNYGIIARPFTNLLKKRQFKWNEEAKVAFVILKQVITITFVLAIPNFNESFTIEIDVVGEGMGVILTQQGKLVAFMSHVLGVTKNHGQPTTKKCLQL